MCGARDCVNKNVWLLLMSKITGEKNKKISKYGSWKERSSNEREREKMKR